MKPKNWRRRFGTAMTSDRELRTLPNSWLRRQADAYRAWLVHSERVTVDAYASACIEDSLRQELLWRQSAVERAIEQLATAHNSYRRKKARDAIASAKDYLCRAETALEDEKAIRAAALDYAVADYISGQYVYPHVTIEEDGAQRVFETPQDFRRAWKTA